MKKILVTLSLALLCFVIGPVNAKITHSAADHVVIKHSVIHMNKKNSDVKVYMEISNQSSQAYTIIAANTPIAKIAQIHPTAKPPAKKNPSHLIALKPKQNKSAHADSFYITLLDLKQTIKPGKIVPITLIFNDGSSIKTKAKVV